MGATLAQNLYLEVLKLSAQEVSKNLTTEV
jgi:hypothetical protein